MTSSFGIYLIQNKNATWHFHFILLVLFHLKSQSSFVIREVWCLFGAVYVYFKSKSISIRLCVCAHFNFVRLASHCVCFFTTTQKRIKLLSVLCKLNNWHRHADPTQNLSSQLEQLLLSLPSEKRNKMSNQFCALSIFIAHPHKTIVVN